ncbi:hypothetical protein [Clostridium grantii]|uniref:Ppx/GppA phosphatase family protein n=1 Tax=Clostridium grantii DSM 8605 TaxID=1121316 RepID=A0A1M5UHI1_9CLOT|nr:hypothetical protein [Clostridium grantii]SHH62495.1 Ppx/GppA phosphatase family protein [Clostridium grantii DSM 8605]
MKKVAIIDVGSNSIKLDIFVIKKDGKMIRKNKVRNFAKIENMLQNNYITNEGMAIILRVVKNYVDLCNNSNVKSIIAVATEAVRKAKNKEDLIFRINSLCQIEMKVISGLEEAKLAFKGVDQKLINNKGYLMDIGGSSTEILSFENNRVIDCYSFPMGARLITNKYEIKDFIDKRTFDSIKKEIINKYFNDISNDFNESEIYLIGTGGIIKNIGKMINHNLNSCLKKDNAYHIKYDDVKNLYDFIEYRKIKDLKEFKGLSERRTDTIKGGIIILACFLEKINCEKIIISKKGIREGLLKEYLEKNLELF